MNRRGFLTAMLAACAAPAIVRAESLMRIVVPTLAEIRLYGDGIHDDTDALQKIIDGATGSIILPRGNYRITSTLRLSSSACLDGQGSKFVIGRKNPIFSIEGEKVVLQNIHLHQARMDTF